MKKPFVLCKVLNNVTAAVAIMLLNVKYDEIGKFTLVNLAEK